MNYVILASSPLLLNDVFYRKIWMFSATQLKENEEATISPLTTIRGRYHGPTVVLVGTDFLLFFLLNGRSSIWMSVGEVKIHPIWVKC